MMCGFAVAFGSDRPSPERVEATLALMRRRGPDANGVHREQLGNWQVTLLATRLAIIDLDSRSHQPFVQDDCVLAFNGEIYNYRELKAELEALGHCFRTASDTEVIVQAYRRYGESCVDRLEGMWAFALLDRCKGTLFLSRDPFGEKPLYYTRSNGTVYFASEIKALVSLSGRRPEVEVEHIRRYLVNGYKALYKQPATFFADICDFPSASSAVVETPEKIDVRRYWRLQFTPQKMTLDEAVDGARAHLERALEIRLRADVPVAFCLSGGVDSSVLAALAAKRFKQQIHTFSIVDRDERYNEAENIEVTVSDLRCEHHVTPTSTDGFFDRLAGLVAYHDGPVATISYYVHSFLSEEISRRGYKVAISGTAADELFTGYYDHYAFWLAEMHGDKDFSDLLDDWKNSYGAFVRNPLLKDPLSFFRNPAQRNHIYLDRELFASFLTAPYTEGFTETPYSDNLLRNRMLNELNHEIVPVILHEDDLNSMQWSVENRSPYLDRSLAEFLYTVPNKHLIQNGYVKWLLRAAVDGLLPDQVRLDKRKRGFNASIDSLVDCNDRDTVERLLAPGPIFDLVRRDAIETFVHGDVTNNSFSKFLFSFISAKLFLESDLVSGAQSARSAA